MTDREKAIVMAYTGICMLTGDKLQIFHKYVEEIMGGPIWSHEFGQLADEIKEKSKADFMELCAGDENGWIPVSEMMPEEDTYVLITTKWEDGSTELGIDEIVDGKWILGIANEGDTVTAWMPLPKPYKAESEESPCTDLT